MERREHFWQDRPRPGRWRVKRLGVDVGGTFTDLIYVDDEAGTVLVHKLPTTPATPRRGPIAGIRELTDDRRRQPRLARPGLPRHDDRDQHRHRAQRRHGRDDHHGGLPRHPPHRAAQEAAQLLELPGPAVAALPARAPPPPPDRPGADHARRHARSSRSTRSGAGAGAAAQGRRRRGGRRLLPVLVPQPGARARGSPRSSGRSSRRRSSRSPRRCCRSTASTSASRRSA